MKENTMNKIKTALANSELSIMELLWKKGSQTARQIREELYPDTDHAQHGTVQRLLQRLEDKGFVRRDKAQTILTFWPMVSRNEYASSQLESLANRLTDGALTPLITHFVEERKISRDDIQQLRELLNNLDSVQE